MSALIAFAPRGRITGDEIPLDEIANQHLQLKLRFSDIFYIVWSCFKVVCAIAVISTRFMMRKTFWYHFELPGRIFRYSLTFMIGNNIFR